MIWLLTFVLFVLVPSARADWNASVPQWWGLGTDWTLDRGVVVGDVIPTPQWPGKEVVTGAFDRVVIFSADGTQRQDLLIPTNMYPYTTMWLHDLPAIGDVNGDDLADIVCSIGGRVGGGGRIYSYSAVIWWTWDTGALELVQHGEEYDDIWFASPRPWGSPLICRTEATSPLPSVIIYGQSREVSSAPLDHDFKMVSVKLSNPPVVDTFLHITRFEDSGSLDTYPSAAGDLDGDGYDEIVTVAPDRLYCLDWNEAAQQWEAMPGFPFEFPEWEDGLYRCDHAAPILCDVNDDGELDILTVVSRHPDENTNEHSRLLRINTAGVVEWVYGQDNPFGSEEFCPAAADLRPWIAEQPGFTESILLSTFNDLRVYRPSGPEWTPNESRIQRPAYVDPHKFTEIAPAIADAEGLGRPQIIFTMRDPGGDAVSVRHYDFLDPLNPYVHPLFSDPAYGHGHRGATSIVDLDNDGLTEEIVMFKSASSSGEANLRIFVRDLNVPYNPELIEWQGFQNGPKHTGLYAQPVSGTQPRDVMTWSGRIIVHDYYLVDEGQTLTIEPGTVVEFRPGASLFVYGTLVAAAEEKDSIYFKPDGTNPWGGIYLLNASLAYLIQCVIHGGDMVYVEGGDDILLLASHIYDMTIGLDVTRAVGGRVSVGDTRIENCELYGIRGTLSSGVFQRCMIDSCGRAGIYWIGDNPVTLEAPHFVSDTVDFNGSGPLPIAGGFFSETTAQLECSHFRYNDVNQIRVENYGDVVMNNNGVNVGLDIDPGIA